MLEACSNYVDLLKNFLWSGPLLIVLLAVGIHQTIIIKGLQFRYLFECLGLTFLNHLKLKKTPQNKEEAGDITAFQAMMTALAGAIGTGNIAGISTAIAVGGFGALFWMWLVAAFGMATAYAETVLSVKHRRKNSSGDMSGGPMYYLRYRLNSRKGATIYAIFVVTTAIGLGSLVQSHSVVDAISGYYPVSKFMAGSILAIISGLVIIGGVKSIGKTAGVLVPFMALGYVITGSIVLAYNYSNIIPGLILIVKSAFVGQAPVGGFLGSTIWLSMQNGAQYGIFANEAGLGSLAIASASAKTNSPVEQGMRSIAGVFIATMIICTITGLVLVVTQVVGAVDDAGLIKGSRLVMLAFGSVNSKFNIIVIFSLAMFAFTTILAWAYYGEKSIEYLFGIKFVIYYRWVFTAFVLAGAVLELDFVWSVANLSTALMAFPNLIALVLLHKEVKSETELYFSASD